MGSVNAGRAEGRRRYLWAAAAWAVGLGVLVTLVVHQDRAALFEALATAGWWLPVLVLSYAGTLFLDSLGWRAVIIHAKHLSLTGLMTWRWVGVSVNALLPVAQLGGEIVRAHLLRRLGPAGPVAAASVIVDLTVGLLTQIVFAVIGLLLLASILGPESSVPSLGLGLAIFSGLIFAFAFLQRRGLGAGLVSLAGRFVAGPIRRRLADGAGQLDDQIRAIHGQRHRLLICAGWRLLGWLWPSMELWLLFWLLGHPIGIAEAIMLEAIAQAVRSAGFAIPGGLGIQEGGVVLAASWLGIPAELALAAMLIRRARELVCGLVGLLVWLALEGAGDRRTARRRIAGGYR